MALNKRTGIIAGGMTAAVAAGVTMFMLLGGDLQSQINDAPCGSVIVLPAGEVTTANITLPNKGCADYITIQSSRAGELPVGQRINPATQGHLLAKLQGSVAAEPVIKTAIGAHHYKFIGVEISTQSSSTPIYDLVRWGEGRQAQKTLADVPHHLSIDRSWIHGFSDQDVQRGVTMNCAECSVTNSHVTDIHMVGIEAQGIAGWNGPGPIHIVNNQVDASTQNIMFGGADCASEALMPADIEIRNNDLFKPLIWKAGDPSYAGHDWVIKNLLELKSGKRIVIDGNRMRNNWTDGQDGKAVLLTVRNQECSAPWSTVQEVTFTNNTVSHAEGGLNLLGIDNEATIEYVTAHPDKCDLNAPNTKLGSIQGSNITISNNLFHDINGGFLFLNAFNNVTLSNNTHLQRGNTITFFGNKLSTGFVYRENVTKEEEFGIRDENGVEGVLALNKWTPSQVFINNTIATPYTKNPAGNDYPPALVITSDYRTPYVGRGCNIDKLLAAQAGSGVSVPLPSPSATVPSPSPSSTVGLPSPSPTSSPTPKPSPTPCVPKVVPLCRSGQVVGNPPQCLCRAGMRGAVCK